MKRSSADQVSSDLKITVYWGDILYDTAVCRERESVSVGDRPGNRFVLDTSEIGGPASGVKLVDFLGDGTADIYFNDKIDGHLRIGEELLSFRSAQDSKHVTLEANGFYRARITEKDKADFVIGHVSFYLDWVKERTQIPRRAPFRWRESLWPLIALGVVAGVSLLISQIEVPEPEKPPERLVTLLPRNGPAKAALGERKTEDGGAQKGEAGKAELKTSDKPSAVANLKRADIGSLVGGLTALGKTAPQVPSQAKSDGIAAPIEQRGTGGFTTIGTGKGAGGKTVGIGRTVGRGEGGFEGTGRLGLSGDSPVEGGTGHGDLGVIQTGGGLDREVIESVIRRRLDRIRLCYERQLNFNPKLAGKVTVHFVIGRKGEVLNAQTTEDTMKNDAVRSCILSEVKTWSFPAPEGGTLVNVDYPFLFESSSKR